jgi:hypothetical protein
MCFDIDGFAGGSGAALRHEQVNNNRELFDFAGRCSQLGMKIAALLPDAEEKSTIVAALLFARSLSHFQAAVCLAEGGMTVEALVLCRGLVETAFVISALAEGAVTPQELASHDAASRVKQANSLLKTNSYPNVSPFKSQLNHFVSKNAGSTAIDMHEFARRGNALALYDGLYRHLSHHAAHPSLSAVDPYLVDMPIGQIRAKFIPLLDYTAQAILSACAGILVSCFACDKAGIRTPETNASGTQMWQDYENLYSIYKPW